MRNILWIALWMVFTFNGRAQESYIKVYDFPVVPAIGYNVQEYDGRIYTIVSLFCDLGGYFTECSFLAELSEEGDTLWTKLIPDIDVASGTMVIVNDTITITGNNAPLNTAFRMVHFTVDGEKLGETIEIEHPTEKFTSMFQLTTQYFNNRYAICGRGIQNDTMRALIYLVSATGNIDTLIQLEKAYQSRLWDSYIDNEGRLTTYHQVEFYRPPGPGPPRINYRRIFKFDTNYDTVWTYRSENTESNDVVPRGCQLHDDRILLSYTNPQQERNIHSVRAINPDGSKDWQHNYVVTGSRTRYILRLKSLANGDIMGSGYYGEKAGDPRIDHSPWLFRMNTEGTLLWERVYYDYDSTLASNGSSRIGALFDFIEVDDGSLLGVGYLDYNSKSDMLVIRMDSNGCLNPEECDEIVYITNYLTTSTESPSLLSAQLIIRPNPTTDYIYIDWKNATEGQRIYITDSTGRLRMTGRFTDGHSKIDVSGLSPGMYFITVAGKSPMAGKFVKVK